MTDTLCISGCGVPTQPGAKVYSVLMTDKLCISACGVPTRTGGQNRGPGVPSRVR